MIRIGLLKERKVPADVRVPITPKYCALIQENHPDIRIVVEPSANRCISDAEYRAEGIEVQEDLSNCDILLGVKEVPIDRLIPEKTYFFFSHTKKKQAYNQKLMQALISRRITMIDYECLTHADEQRILGFGFYAGIVGAHNGLLAYGKKSGAYDMPEAYKIGSYAGIMAAYDRFKLPPLKIVITGSGKVAAGALNVMNMLDVEPVEPGDFLTHEYDYPVYTHLRGSALYARKDNDLFSRDDFHANPAMYKCLFSAFVNQTDLLINGVYWEQDIPRLFDAQDIQRKDWRISVIADITCDMNGSVPINFGSTHIGDAVYGIDRKSLQRCEPNRPLHDSIDIMAVDNLPNELPRDASQYFSVHFEKYIIAELLKPQSDILKRATICRNGLLTEEFEYLADYAYEK
jgi:alanine dehydrogenase